MSKQIIYKIKQKIYEWESKIVKKFGNGYLLFYVHSAFVSFATVLCFKDNNPRLAGIQKGK